MKWKKILDYYGSISFINFIDKSKIHQKWWTDVAEYDIKLHIFRYKNDIDIFLWACNSSILIDTLSKYCRWMAHEIRAKSTMAVECI